MHLTTPRLTLRPLQETDGPAIAQATDETWDDLQQWMRWAIDRQQRTDPVNCATYAKNCNEAFQQKTDFTFGAFLKDNNDFVLLSRLATGKEPSALEFCGYWCRKKYQGQGFMTEAVSAIIRYAFDELHATRLQIRHAAGNQKTRAVMDHAGFVKEAVLRNAHQLPDGSFVDEHVLYLTKDQWQVINS
ncbi:MAG: GCN5-related N-acetyltransferase [Alphaproteobacteria bacterium]|nr:GCN5-related N-acetyltransferase [Alphaproteobacteria bacterium]